MVSSKIFMFYMMFLIIFNLLTGLFALNDQNTGDVSIKKELFTNNIRNNINSHINSGFIKTVINLTALPFMILESLLFVIALVGVGIVNVPIILNVIIFSPLGIMVILDYVIPVIRGN